MITRYVALMMLMVPALALARTAPGTASDPVAENVAKDKTEMTKAEALEKTTGPLHKTLLDPKKLDFFDLSATTGAGDLVNMSRFKGNVVLVVNTTGTCGPAPQFGALQKLQERYQDKGLVVLGFPSADIGAPEPGPNGDLEALCKKAGVTFPIFGRAPVAGKDKQPVFEFLTRRSPEGRTGEVKASFEKFLVDRDGRVVARFDAKTGADSPSLVKSIEEQLRK